MSGISSLKSGSSEMCGAAWRSLNRTESPHFRQYGKKEFRNRRSEVRGSSEWQISYMPDCSTGSPGTRVQSDCSKLLRNGCWCCMGYCGLLRRFSSIGFSTETSGYGWIQMPLFLHSLPVGTPPAVARVRVLCVLMRSRSCKLEREEPGTIRRKNSLPAD